MTIGFALCGSFCTYSQVLPIMKTLAENHDIIPILSEISQKADTRFGTAQSHWETICTITGRQPLTTIPEVEPIGPKKLLDALIIAPCTGNTLAKLAHSIADTSVTMAAKSHLRNGRPVLIAVSTNDKACYDRLIAAGVGIGIAREDTSTEGVYLDVTDFDEHYTVYAYYKKQAYYGNVKHFIDFLKA